MESTNRLGVPIIKESLDRRAAAQLREAIFSGDLSPGTRITEQSIASQLGLSRGTVRSALHRLAAEGLIVQNIYSSWEVMGLTADDADELFTLRASLEGLAGRLAAGRIIPERKDLLVKAFQHLHEAAKTGTEEDLADADLGVHFMIVKLSGNKRLIQYYRQVEVQLRMYIRSVNGLMPSPESVAPVHEPMVNAVLDGDPVQAEALLIEHSVFYGEKLVDLFKRQEVESAQERKVVR